MTKRILIQPWIIILSIVFWLFYGSCTELDELEQTYSIEISYDSIKGSVECLPGVKKLRKYEHVVLAAVSKEGYAFKHWKGLPAGCDSTKTETSFSIQDSLNIVALFDSLKPEDGYSLEVIVDDTKGVVEISNQKSYYENGENITISAISKDGYAFKYWEGMPDGCDSTQSEVSFEIQGHLRIIAHFTEKEGNAQYSLVVTADETKGNVELSNFKELYEEGEMVTLTVSAKEGYKFLGWYGDTITNENSITLTMTQNYNITANFEESSSNVNTNILFFCGIEYNIDNKEWDINALLKNIVSNKELKDAIITVGGKKLDYIGNYSYNTFLTELAANTTLQIEVSHEEIGNLNYNIQVPKEFSEDYTYVLDEDKKELTINFQDLGSDKYRIFRRLHFESGNKEEKNNNFPGGTAWSSPQILKTKNIWNFNIPDNEVPQNAELWVCPINFKHGINGSTNKSYIQIIGKPGNTIHLTK
jgi:uncharacterized repeat protein (TIGR02543 family)